MNTSKRQIRRQ